MAEKKPPTHRAYCTKRVNHNAVIFLEVGTATEHADGRGSDIQLDRLPVGGFNGFIRIRPLHERQDAPPAPPATEEDF